MKIHETWALYSPDFWVCGLAWYWRAAWAVLGPVGLLIMERLLGCLATLERCEGARRFQRAVRRALLIEIAIVGLVVAITYARAVLYGWKASYRDDSQLFEWTLRLIVLAAPVIGVIAFARDAPETAPPPRENGRTSTWLGAAAVLALAYIGPPPVAIIFPVVWPNVWTDACLVEMMVMTSDPEDRVETPENPMPHGEFSAATAQARLGKRSAEAHVLEFARRHRTGEGRYPEVGHIKYRPARYLFESMDSTDAALDEMAAWAREYPDPKVRDVAHDTLVDRIAARKKREAEEARKRKERETRRAPAEPSGAAPAAAVPSGGTDAARRP